MDKDPLYAALENSRFWIQKVLVPILLCIGFVGNTFTIMVLTRRRMRNSTNVYLSALAIADIFHLVFGFLLSFTHYRNIHDRKYELYWRFYGLTHWLCDAASATSAWLTVSFTAERYVAVCYPMKGKQFCTERRAKSIIVIIYIFCLLTTVSTTFEYQLTFNEECLETCRIPIEGRSNGTIGNNSTIGDVISNVTSHVIIPPSYDIIKHRGIKGVENYIHNQLRNILANCSNNPHIIYVSIQPDLLNVSDGRQAQHPKIAENEQERTTVRRREANGVEQLDNVKDIVQMNGTDTDSKNKDKDVLHSEEDVTNYTHTCCLKNLTIDVESTELSRSVSYLNFIYWYSALCFGIIPLMLIAVFNCFLIRAVYSSQRIRRQMTNSTECVSFTNERKISIILIGIVIAFLVCNTPTSAHLIYYHFHRPATVREDIIMRILGNVFNLLLMLNAPCNFLIYCVLSKKFRATFKKIFCERRKGRRIDGDTLLLASTKSTRHFDPYKHGLMKRKNVSEYSKTPRNIETQSLTSIPRSKSLMARPVGKAKSTDLVV